MATGAVALCWDSVPAPPVRFHPNTLSTWLSSHHCSSVHCSHGASTEAHNEESYLVGIPPCLWGSEAEGLLPPPRLHLDANLTSIKRVNNTNGHWGVMALWQMRAAYDGQSKLPLVVM